MAKANLLGGLVRLCICQRANRTRDVTCFFGRQRSRIFASTPGRASSASRRLCVVAFISCVSILATMMSPRIAAATVLTLCLGASSVEAFQSVATPSRPITALSAAQSNNNDETVSMLGGVRGVAAAFTLFAMTTLSGPAGAVSGGGLDYANIDITGQDFSNEAKAYKGKDFSVSVQRHGIACGWTCCNVPSSV